ncbi:MAG: putative lipid II flippase FtsW [Pedosphaera sp.]|nr:putative lipid II flippase FtsW [Pedosphaera sp.]
MKAAITALVGSVAALLSLGLVILYSASVAQTGRHYLALQMVWAVIGVGTCFVLASMDYRRFKKWALPIWIVALALLALVLVPEIGTMKNGARRWINIGVANIQPSEFAKLALILMIAMYGDRFMDKMATFKHGLLFTSLIAGVTLGLIFVEPDFGTTGLLFGVVTVMLFVGGANWKHIVPPALATLVAIGVAIWNDPVRMKRIVAFMNPEEHKTGIGFQAYQAMLALGSGGWFGLGLGNGRQKLGFVPEHHTDFIFSVIGEELGFVTSLFVVLAFAVLVGSALYIATRAADRFGLLLATGIGFLIGFQALINIGVVTSALPNKGLPLPFISYGGSSLVMMLACVGILLSIANHVETDPSVSADPAGATEPH